jgi:hypothetical protein
MNRRQFVIGLGATAAGGGTAMGTGAFTSVNADRDATVAVANENSAYLRIIPSTTPNGAFANQLQTSGNKLALDFNDSIPDRPDGDDAQSEGVGQSSEYEFDDVFRIQNQGTQTVYVNITDVMTHSDNTTTEFYVPDGSGGRHHLAPGENALEISTGTTENIGVYIDTAEEGNYSTPDPDDDDAVITASATTQDNIV